MGEREPAYRELGVEDLGHIADLDRTERIDALYRQRGTELVKEFGDFNAPNWSTDGTGPHSVAGQVMGCRRYFAQGGSGFGAFEGERMVGIGVVVPDIRPGIAQLAYLDVTNGRRGQGIGRRLTRELERVAREAGDTAMVVSATPSVNTVEFYMRLGFAPMAEPLPELFALEPEDVHLRKELR